MSRDVVNLLPQRYRRAAAYRKIIADWTSVLIVVVVVCVMGISWQRTRYLQAASEVQSLREEGARVEQMVAANDALRNHLRDLKFASLHLGSLQPTDDLLQTLASVAVSGGTTAKEFPRIRTLRINLRKASVEPANQDSSLPLPQRSGGAAAAELCLTLLGENQLQLQQWMQRLEADPRIDDVRLGRSGIDATTGGYQTEVLARVMVHKETP